jgi:hypothetical protein
MTILIPTLSALFLILTYFFTTCVTCVLMFCKAGGSVIAVSKEPKCFVDTGICSVTWTKVRDEMRKEARVL